MKSVIDDIRTSWCSPTAGWTISPAQVCYPGRGCTDATSDPGARSQTCRAPVTVAGEELGFVGAGNPAGAIYPVRVRRRPKTAAATTPTTAPIRTHRWRRGWAASSGSGCAEEVASTGEGSNSGAGRVWSPPSGVSSVAAPPTSVGSSPSPSLSECGGSASTSPVEPRARPRHHDQVTRAVRSGQHEHGDAQEPHQRLDRDVGLRGDDVLAPGDEDHDEVGEHRHAEGRAHWMVPGPVQELVAAAVPGQPALDEGIGVHAQEEQPGHQHAGEERVGITWPKARISQGGKRRSAPSSHPTYQSGWAAVVVADGSYGPHNQTGLIWARPPSRARTANRPEEQRHRPGGVGGEEVGADHVALVPPGTRELRVLLAPHEREVHRHQRGDQGGDDEDVEDVEPAEVLVAGELAAEEDAHRHTPTTGIDSPTE